MTLQIRDGTEQDHEAIIAISKALPQWFSEKGVREIAQDLAYERILVAEQDFKIKGFLSYFTYNGVGHLAWIGVSPEVRRQGIGKMLVKEFEKRMSVNAMRRLRIP